RCADLYRLPDAAPGQHHGRVRDRAVGAHVRIRLPHRSHSALAATRRLELADDLFRRGDSRLHAEGYLDGGSISRLHPARPVHGGIPGPELGRLQKDAGITAAAETHEEYMPTVEQRDEIHLPKGAVLFRQGDPGNEMFVVSKGRVRLTIGSEGNEKQVAAPGPGEFFGDLSLLSDTPRTATAVALEDSTLLVIGRDAFAMMVQDDLDIVFGMLNIQGKRLSLTNEPIQQLMEQLGRIRVAAHCLQRLIRSSDQSATTLDIGALAREVNLSA